jgi:hypothetical protein
VLISQSVRLSVLKDAATVAAMTPQPMATPQRGNQSATRSRDRFRFVLADDPSEDEASREPFNASISCIAGVGFTSDRIPDRPQRAAFFRFNKANGYIRFM